mmetsp:Transcript_13407/g.18326  ORF Transcript_13407/g.18326 Transcript_13407/m.18326 type:complete len:366 (+) Transcript_13407:135-1232(+)|eukprot:CAMPEP_0196579940 /NCGR_PEP_ID=MMETSP1081-20130531/25846_1 /TAXON_ID=36882 /ORGANISM="Pyramimonas amylifera, Strain CCMP720" /LENGTH=365 /DNA_ID=CAMNT_0041899669 /DNA_START=135 /DNA_END=1232 /DNA_ORIENTATION=+
MSETCTICESYTAEWHCRSCGEQLCGECDSSVHAAGSFARHRRNLLKKEVVELIKVVEVVEEPKPKVVQPKTTNLEGILKLLKQIDDKDAIDQLQFIEMLDLENLQLFDKFLNMFVGDLSKETEIVQEVLYTNGTLVTNEELDLPKLRFHLHKVRGMCSTIGCKIIVENCKEWSEDYLNNPQDHKSETHFESLNKSVLYTIDVVKRFCKLYKGGDSSTSPSLTLEGILKLLKRIDEQDTIDQMQFIEMLDMQNLPMFEKFLNMFIGDLRSETTTVQEILYPDGTLISNEKLDLPNLRFHLHKVRGMSSTIGCKAIVENCKEWSEDYINNPVGHKSEDHFQSLNKSVGETVELVKKFWKEVLSGPV